MELVSVATAIMLYSLGLHQAPGGAKGQDPLVMIRQGSLRGIKVYTEEGRLINAFLGVPYAAPPLGDLRFAPPVRHEGWNRSTSLFAGKFAPACPQVQPVGATISVPQDEDCLYLNIWTPESVSAAYRGGAPVVVFLEGEGFVSGLASRFPAQDLAAEGVIVVSASYRLNVFGFFCLEDEVARGNLGLLDQYFALLWVRENVEAFGGDPRSVTLMGHSAGAASVVYHMTSPRTSGLFHRAIIMSGSVASPWSGIRHPRNSSRAIARSLGCFAPTSRAILSCLRSKSVPEILRAFEAQYKNGNWTELVLPVVDTFLPKDEQYLPRDPVEVLESGNFLGIPILTGTASHEGVVTLYQWGDLARQTYTQLRNFFEKSALPGVIERYGFTQSPHVRDTLLWWYVERARDGDTAALLNSLLQLYSDAEFVAPHARQMELLSRSPEPMYVYRFQASGGPDLYGNTLNISGTAHGSEFLYLMGPTLMSRLGGRRFTRDEDIFSKRVKRFWVDFIRQGNPNPAGSFGYASQWQRAIPGDYKCFALQLGTGSCGDEAQEAARLWNDLLPHLAESPPSPPPKKAPDPQLGTGGNGQPFRSAMYILVGFVIVLLVLLIICLVLLKRHAKERERDLF